MTVNYSDLVPETDTFSNFVKLLFLWRGSVFKLVWPELTVYLVAYAIISIIYRFLLNEQQRATFEQVSIVSDRLSDMIPISFVLGFYVSLVVTRWWRQFEEMPWPDSISLFISTEIHGQDPKGRLLRRTIVRYINLTFALTYCLISSIAKRRFPNYDKLVEQGFMTLSEKRVFEKMDSKTEHSKYWMPLAWAGSLVIRARKEGRIKDDFAVKTIMDEIVTLRAKCGDLIGYDWVNIPLVYTQVVTLAVYSLTIASLFGRQFLDVSKNIPNHDVDYYVPLFTILQLGFYMGWLKVAEALVNPFGGDDDDFEVNWIIDRNLEIAYIIVDEMHEELPEMLTDKFWNDTNPMDLPFSLGVDRLFSNRRPSNRTDYTTIDIDEPPRHEDTYIRNLRLSNHFNNDMHNRKNLGDSQFG